MGTREEEDGLEKEARFKILGDAIHLDPVFTKFMNALSSIRRSQG